jgi:LacI family transcriptional regulator
LISPDKVTIYTVAREAGVSISTVSRILNRTFKGSEDIRCRVQEIIERSNYQPSPAARRLTGKTVATQMIGIMAPFFIHPFFVEVLKGIYQVIHEEGCHAILYDVDSRMLKKSTVRRIVADGLLDGVLLVNMHLNQQEYDELSESIPAFFIAAEVKFADYVMIDNYAGMSAAVDCVHELGHRTLGFINNEKNIYESQIREKAFIEQAAKRGVRYKIDYRQVDRRSGYLGAKNILENNPEVTCLVYYSDLMAFGGLDYLNERNLRHRISIIGFDGFEMTFQVGLTTIVQPMEQMGEEGARSLFELMAARPATRIQKVIEPWLFKGETCQRMFHE